MFNSILFYIVSNDTVSRQWKPWLDCVNTQADLGLHCPQMPYDTFSWGAGGGGGCGGVGGACTFKGTGYTWKIFHHFYKGDNFCDFLFAFLYTNPIPKRFTLKGMNVLPFFRFRVTLYKQEAKLFDRVTSLKV